MSGSTPFDGYTGAELRESANYLSRLQDDTPPPRRLHRRCFDPSGWIVMSWVEHTIDALDLLDEILDEWEARGDGGCTTALRDRVKEAVRG